MKRTIITKVNLYVDIIDFFNFLSEHNALMQYLCGLHRNYTGDPQFYLNTTPDSWLSGAFGWVTTPQGHKYWEELNDKWRGILYNGADSSEVTIKASGK